VTRCSRAPLEVNPKQPNLKFPKSRSPPDYNLPNPNPKVPIKANESSPIELLSSF